MIYNTPGVYVEEQPSTSQPIIGVGTTIPVFLSFYRNYQQNKKKIEIIENTLKYELQEYPVIEDARTFNYKNAGQESSVIKSVILSNDNVTKKSYCTLEFNTTTQAKSANQKAIELTYLSISEPSDKFDFVKCNSFNDFVVHFGDFTIHPEEKSLLAHAVLGFFQNGGTRCYVVRGDQITQVSDNSKSNVDEILKFSENYEDISLVIPVGTAININERSKIIEHCGKMKDRFAIFHFEEKDQTEEDFLKEESKHRGKAAVYHPWVKVFDPAENKDIDVPPSGHVAGIYARVDDQQGVQKCPANEVVVGVKDVSIGITKEKQDALNPEGINCIRVINGKIKVWGARTLDIGTDNLNNRYINVCRSFMYLSESIEKGTQWAVFQPNTIALRQQIVRNITDFLLIQWRAGMLFGETQQEAFRVQCDAETNSNAVQGELKAIVQVALVRPAEFIIIQISHKQAS